MFMSYYHHNNGPIPITITYADIEWLDKIIMEIELLYGYSM